jgi:hypothetical protein
MIKQNKSMQGVVEMPGVCMKEEDCNAFVDGVLSVDTKTPQVPDVSVTLSMDARCESTELGQRDVVPTHECSIAIKYGSSPLEHGCCYPWLSKY